VLEPVSTKFALEDQWLNNVSKRLSVSRGVASQGAALANIRDAAIIDTPWRRQIGLRSQNPARLRGEGLEICATDRLTERGRAGP
jgi:hypothetical protein